MRPRLRDFDRPLAGVALLLAGYGLATLYSAGQTDVPTFVSTIWHKQLIWLAVGAVATVLVFRTSPRLVEWATPYVYALAVVILVFTLAVGSGGGTAAGSKSWIAIGGLRIGQPAELAKLAVILMLARWLAERREAPATMRDLVYPCVIAGVPCLLVAKQPDLGSAIVFVAILFAMLYWAGTKPSLLLLLGSPAIGLILAFSTTVWGAWIIVLFALLLWWRPYVWEGLTVMTLNIVMGVIALPFWRHLAPYQQNRLLAFLNPDVVDKRAAGWHIIQSKIAIGSGGVFGKGYLKGSQKALAYLPMRHTDFIYSVVGEELGLLGALTVVLLYAVVIVRGYGVAVTCRNGFASLTAVGLTTALFYHIMVNMLMTVGWAPVTGLPLPLLSYGGTALLANGVQIGILQSAALRRREL